MKEGVSDGFEMQIQRALDEGDTDAAVTRAIERYGPEILGFLVGFLRDADAADDVFSIFCEDVWRGLERFRKDCALRTWMYVVARHAAARYRREAYHRRREPLSSVPCAEAAARVRTETLTYLRTETRSAVERLREQLVPEDRALLILRIDRKLSWNDIAAIMADEGAALSAEDLQRSAAALRKRFERVKDRLRRLAESEGLLKR